MAEWAILLSEFDIRFEGRTALKAQVLADFVVEFVGLEPVEIIKTEPWIIHVDGASSNEGAGVGVYIQGLERIRLTYSAKLAFPATNNAAEYEAVIKGLELAKDISPDKMILRSDSRLVLNQINNNFETKGESMIKYLRKVQALIEELERRGVQWKV